jgi:hypothetical protein
LYRSIQLITGNMPHTHTLYHKTHTLFLANSHYEHQRLPVFMPLPVDNQTSYTLHTIFIQCVCEWGFKVWSFESPGNHWLSLVLIKENNSLTCTEMVQNRLFDGWHSQSHRCFLCAWLINNPAPWRERDGGERETDYMWVAFSVWNVRCDFGTMIFRKQCSITAVAPLFIVPVLFFDKPSVSVKW